MKHELANYEIFPKIIASDTTTRLTISPLGSHAAFTLDTSYLVRFLPMCETREGEKSEYESVILQSKDGSLTFEHAFPGEQAHIIRVFRLPIRDEGKDRPVGNFMVYSLQPDLFALRPFKGDFHAHTCESDGTESPAIVAANYRKNGFDFMAITDHRRWAPSVEAIKAYAGQPVDIKLFPGEEVHPPENHVHMVNFGGSSSINELFNNDRARYEREVNEIMLDLDVPEGVNRYEYASCLWVFDQIRQVGGLGIYCHPYWIANVYHVSERFSDLIFAKKPFDAFELLGGHEVHSNNIQTAYYQEARANGLKIPIVGSSDSHGSEDAMWFNWFFTLAFAESLELKDIRESIMTLNSVAIEHYPGEAFRVYGPFRLVKYADFLLNEYFPLHDQLCVEEGRLMKAYICGDVSAMEQLRLLHCRTAALLKCCFGE